MDFFFAGTYIYAHIHVGKRNAVCSRGHESRRRVFSFHRVGKRAQADTVFVAFGVYIKTATVRKTGGGVYHCARRCSFYYHRVSTHAHIYVTENCANG
jgi:hypothetical protein